MRWDFDPPQTETVVSDGRKLYDYQPDLNQVVEMPIGRAFKSAAPLAFLLGIGNIRRDFIASLTAPAPSDPLLRVLLVPKSGGDRIEMGLNPSTYDLMAVKVIDALGNTTSIRFSSMIIACLTSCRRCIWTVRSSSSVKVGRAGSGAPHVPQCLAFARFCAPH